MSDFDLSQILERREAGRLYKLAPASVGFDLLSGLVDTDPAKMTATARISTPTLDRTKDRMSPRGCVLDNYRLNPVVLWEHGFDDSLPIGMSDDENGNLAVSRTAKAVTATCRFSQSNRKAAQIYAMVDEGMIRATSVRALPIVGKTNKEGGVDIDEWDLEEWSFCAVGMNPEAVREVISKGRLAGEPIEESLLKTLRVLAPPKSVRGRGWKKADVVRFDLDASDVDNESSVVVMEQQPYGKTFVGALVVALADFLERGRSGWESLEHPSLRSTVGKALDGLEKISDVLRQSYADAYSDQLDKEKSSPLARGQSLARFLSANFTARVGLKGVDDVLRSLAQSKALSESHRQALVGVLGRLGELADSALKHVAPAVDAEQVKALKAECAARAQNEQKLTAALAQMTDSMQSLNRQLADIMPYQDPIGIQR